MDEKQLMELIQQILLRIKNESTVESFVLPKAYIMLTKDWRDMYLGQCKEILQKVQGSYYTIAVLPEGDGDVTDFYEAGFCSTVKRSDVKFPSEDFLTIFPYVSKNLVVKTALCIEDDFESKWIAKCLSYGQPIFMKKESPLFTGRETDAYKRKIQAYYQEVELFGIRFDELPELNTNMSKSMLCMQSEKKTSFLPDKIQHIKSDKKRIITAEDLHKLNSKEVRLQPGDIITKLAAERAEEYGIQILYQK